MTTEDIPALIARLRNESGVATARVNERVALMDEAADTLEAEHKRAAGWEQAFQAAFDKEAEMAVRFGLFVSEHEKAGKSWDRTRKRLEAEAQTFREQYIPRLTKAEAERDALRDAIQHARLVIKNKADTPALTIAIVRGILSRAIDTKEQSNGA